MNTTPNDCVQCFSTLSSLQPAHSLSSCFLAPTPDLAWIRAFVDFTSPAAVPNNALHYPHFPHQLHTICSLTLQAIVLFHNFFYLVSHFYVILCSVVIIVCYLVCYHTIYQSHSNLLFKLESAGLQWTRLEFYVIKCGFASQTLLESNVSTGERVKCCVSALISSAVQGY